MGCFLSSKVKSNESFDQSPLNELTGSGNGEILESSKLWSFGYNDLKTCTRNFTIGEGVFGRVFKGWINEQTYAPVKPGTGLGIAVKRVNQEGVQGHQEWLAEINYLSQLHHPNLEKLIGYCLEEEQRLLVYEFMPRGSLENHLFRRSAYFQPLSWNLRMKVALGAAKGLAFLHTQRIKVIYRYFKPSNILIDSDYNAKLSDFGLEGDGPTGYVSFRLIGPTGYAAPEYVFTGHLTTRSDIYGFGVVLLELMSGKRVLDRSRHPKEWNLVEWAFPYLKSKRKFFRIMDTRIQGQYPQTEAARVGKLALQCLSVDPRFRPSMNEVVAELEDLQVVVHQRGNGMNN